jgi:hypothetical protein
MTTFAGFKRRLKNTEAQLRAAEQPTRTLEEILSDAKAEAKAREHHRKLVAGESTIPPDPGPPPNAHPASEVYQRWQLEKRFYNAAVRTHEARQHLAGHICHAECPLRDCRG